MSDKIKKGCDAILYHEDNLEIGTCRILKMITDEATKLTKEIERLNNRDGKARIILCYETPENPFEREELSVIDFGVADNEYIVERIEKL